MPDVSTLIKLLTYEPSTGIFRWTKRPSMRSPKSMVGSRAGMKGSSGYRYIKFGGKLHREHVLVYAICGKAVPKGMEIDHINGDRADNRACNLRIATHQQNLANCRNRKNNTSGFKGVTLHSDGRWRAKLMVSGRTLHVGLFESPEEASLAYEAAARKHFGEFARAF